VGRNLEHQGSVLPTVQNRLGHGVDGVVATGNDDGALLLLG
jgi:hypothetical protein